MQPCLMDEFQTHQNPTIWPTLTINIQRFTFIAEKDLEGKRPQSLSCCYLKQKYSNDSRI